MVVESDGQDVRSAAGLRTSLAVQRAIEDSDLADTLIEAGQQPPIASYLGGAEMAVEMQELDPASRDDEQVRQLQDRSIE